MAKAKQPKAAATAANPFSALVQAQAQATTQATAKVHALTVAGVPLTAAHHVATFKGMRPVAVGGVTYALTANAYNPTQNHVNATQWQAVQAAFTANNGNPVTVHMVAQQFAALGLPGGLAGAFMRYRASGGKPNLALVQAA